jgi:uncharacterized membrane protein
LRRTYYGIYAAVLITWVIRLDLEGPTSAPLDLVRRAGIASIPGWVVVGIVLTLYALLTICTVLAHRLYPEGDDWTGKSVPFPGGPD